MTIYDHDLAHIHNVGFGGIAEGCAPGLLKLLHAAGIHDSLVVDLGCGGGIWAGHLVQAGYEVLGVDDSPAMIDYARQQVPSANFAVGSIWKGPIPACRAVTAISEVLCYRSSVNQKQDFGRLFRKIFQALPAGGLWIFDVVEVGLGRHRPQAFSEGDDWACLVNYEHDQSRELLIRQITSFRKVGELFRRSHERHIVQLYRAADVAAALRKTGFRVRMARRIGEFPLLPHRVAFIARKP